MIAVRRITTEYNDDYNDEDYDDVSDQIDEFERTCGIGISKYKLPVLIAVEGGTLKGVVWGVWGGAEFNFDIAVSKDSRNTGIANLLIDATVDLYESEKWDYSEAYGEDPKITATVVNPIVVRMLLKRGFTIDREIGSEVFMERE